jgi:hypothetical protein
MIASISAPSKGLGDLDNLLRFFPCQLLLCGSANNEGWERRRWSTRVYHGIDKVPEDVLVEDLKTMPGEVELLDEHFGRYPLETLAAMKVLGALPADETLVDGVTARIQKLLNYVTLRLANIAEEFRNFLNRKEHCEDFMLSVLTTPFHIGKVALNGHAYDRRFLTTDERAVLHAIHNVAHSAMRRVSMSHKAFYKIIATSAVLQMPMRGLQYESMFNRCAGALLMSSGKATEMSAIHVEYDLPSRGEVDTLQLGLTLATPCHRAENVDFYLFTADETTVNCTVLQLTTDKSHLPSHEFFATKKREAMGNRTMLQQLRDNGVNGRIAFVYITDNKHFTQKLSSSSTCLNPSPDLHVFSMLLRNYEGKCQLVYLQSLNCLDCYTLFLPTEIMLPIFLDFANSYRGFV